jgi:hypothetical protein
MEIIGLLIIWAIGGAIVGIVANSKNRDPIGWFFYGLAIWPVALVHVLVAEPLDPSDPRTPANTAARMAGAQGSEAAKPVVTERGWNATDEDAFQVAAAWRAEGRNFTMIEAKEEARLRRAERAYSSRSAAEQKNVDAPDLTASSISAPNSAPRLGLRDNP